MNGFAKLIYELRKEKGLTQAELGEKLGITDKAISRWENGDSYPETAQLIPISALFDITIDELLKGKRNADFQEETNDENNSAADSTPYPFKRASPLTPGQTLQLLVALVLMFLGVLAIVVLSSLDVHYVVYLSVFFFLVAIAVAILTYMGMGKLLMDSKLSFENTGKIRQYIFQVALGVAFFILTPAGFIAIAVSQIWGACAAFVLFTAGLCLTVYGGIGWDRDFLSKQTAAASWIAGEKEPRRRRTFKSRIIGMVMPLATAAFLVLGFLFDLWHPGWLVFPLGGLLCGVLGILLGD